MALSACWIVKNEAETLRRSIESVRDAVTELVVVDTGSTDETVAVAKELGARVESFEWTHDFSAARNFALAQCTSGVVIFPDADEWFVPALTRADGEKILARFEKKRELDALQLSIHNLTGEGAVKSTSIGNRILRRKKGLGFQKRVHEQFLRDDGGLPVIPYTDAWTLWHTGYTEEMLPEKMRRNVALLEQVAEQAADPMERYLQHSYLVREYTQLGDPENALRHLRAVLAEPELFRRQIKQYNQGIAPLVYAMLIAANELRGKISRREIRKKIVEPFGKLLPAYPGSATIALYYEALFDLKEDELLQKTGPAIAAARRLPASPMSHYSEGEMIINHRAAEAAYRRRRLGQAMDFAIASFVDIENMNDASLKILLRCIKGQPAEDTLAFLNSLFDVSNPKKLEFVSTNTRLDGFQSVYAYYLKKKIDIGTATKGEYLYLLLLFEKYAESLEAARELLAEKNTAGMRHHLLLAAICSGDEAVYRDNAELLAPAAGVLDAYFSGLPLAQPGAGDIGIVLAIYELVAFAAGLTKAQRLLDTISNQPLAQFGIKANYCVENALYNIPLKEAREQFWQDISCARYLTHCLIMTGDYSEALRRLEQQIDAGALGQAALNGLLAVADCAAGETAARARQLYDAYRPLWDWRIDLEDVQHTGYIPDENEGKKAAKGLKSLTAAQLGKLFDEEAQKPELPELAALCEALAEIYRERGLLAHAAACLRYSATHGENKDACAQKLRETLNAAGNPAV